MSSRTVPRFAPTLVLVAALATPGVAQDPLPQAPPPRESGDVVRSIHTYNIGLLRELYGLPHPAVAPAPREKADDSIEIESSFGTVRIRVLEAATGSFPLGNPPAAAPGSQDHIIRRQLEPQMPQPVPPGPVGAPAPRPERPAVMSSIYDLWWDNEPETAPAPRARAYEAIGWQKLRGDVYALVPMTPPEAPAPTMCPPQAPVIAPAPAGCCAASPFACEGHAPRLPQPTAFVIGVGGLHRVMPMPDPPRFLVAPTPVPTGSFAINSQAGCCGSAVVKQTQTGTFMIGVAAPRPISVPLHGAVNFAYEVCPPCPMPVVPANPLNGTWYRDLGVALVAVTFAGDEMTVRMTQGDGDVTMTMTLTAHCTVTRDGLVYGAITSADVDVKGGDPKGMELAELSLTLQEAIDGPFSFRAKTTSAGLMVSHLKIAAVEGARSKELAIFGGLFKHAKDGKVPELKPIKTSGPVGRCETGAAIGSAVGAAVGAPLIGHCQTGAAAGALTGAPLNGASIIPPLDGFERVGVDFNSNTPPMSRPVAPGAALAPPLANVGPPAPVAPPCAPQPVRPASANAPPDAMKQMAQDALQQMIREKDRCGGMTLPSPRYLEHYPQYFIPDVAFPLPRELASQEDPEGVARRGGCCATAAKPGVVGKWVREVGTKRCVITIAADHFTATVSEAHGVDGKTVTGHLTFTVDYHLTRDGVTAVGLVTSVDATCDGDLANGEAEGMTQWLGELRRALEDKPIALTLRLYGDALVIGNVRAPSVYGAMESEPSTYIGGRYRAAGDKPLPALKAVKCEPRPLPTYGPAIATPPGGFGPPIPCPIAYPPGCGFPAVPPGGFVPMPGLPPGLAYPPAPVYAPAAPTGDLLPPQNLSQPPRPVPAPAASLPPIPTVDAGTPTPTVQVIEAVTIPEPRPSMTPPTAPVPTMPEPIAPIVSVKEKKIPATEMAVAWRNKITSLPDPTKNGAETAGLAGQLFLYGGSKLQFAPADGTLTVDLVDETPRPDRRAPTPERWQFDAEALRKLFTNDETFGKSYTLFLPWPACPPDVSKVRISVRYDPKSGHTLYQAPTVVCIEPAKLGAPTMPEPTAPATALGLTLKVGCQPFLTAPPLPDNELIMQRKLYRSEAPTPFDQICNEWRRFWFNDLPPDAAAERVHSGVR